MGKKGFTLTFAVGFVVSDGRSRNGFAVGRDAPTIARPLMALLCNIQEEELLFSASFLFFAKKEAFSIFCLFDFLVDLPEFLRIVRPNCIQE